LVYKFKSIYFEGNISLFVVLVDEGYFRSAHPAKNISFSPLKFPSSYFLFSQINRPLAMIAAINLEV